MGLLNYPFMVCLKIAKQQDHCLRRIRQAYHPPYAILNPSNNKHKLLYNFHLNPIALKCVLEDQDLEWVN